MYEKMKDYKSAYETLEEYIQNYNNKPSLSKLSKKYKIGSKTISDKLKSLGYEFKTIK